MILLIIGLHFVLGSIWLMNNNYPVYAIISFLAGMAATHYGWKSIQARRNHSDEN